MYVECDYCGKGKSKSKSEVRRHKRNFCSKQCKQRYFLNGHTKNEIIEKILDYIDDKKYVKREELADVFDISMSTAYNYLKELRESEKVVMERIRDHGFFYRRVFND